MHPPFHKWTESAQAEQRVSTVDLGCYNFMSGAGGWAQSLYHGFGGLEYTDDGLVLRPVLVRAIAPRIVWRGLRLRGVRFRLEASAEAAAAAEEVAAEGGRSGQPPPRTRVTVCVTEGVAHVKRRQVGDAPSKEDATVLRAGDGRGADADGAACATFLLGAEEAGLLLHA